MSTDRRRSPAAVRATIADKARNTTVYQTPVAAGPAITGRRFTQPVLSRRRRTPGDRPAIGSRARWLGQAWQPINVASAVRAARSRGRRGNGQCSFAAVDERRAPQDDGLTAYGRPRSQPYRQGLRRETGGAVCRGERDARVPAHCAGATQSTDATSAEGCGVGGILRRQVAAAGAVSAGGRLRVAGQSLTQVPARPPAKSLASATIRPSMACADVRVPSNIQPKLVGSRTFAFIRPGRCC